MYPFPYWVVSLGGAFKMLASWPTTTTTTEDDKITIKIMCFHKSQAFLQKTNACCTREVYLASLDSFCSKTTAELSTRCNQSHYTRDVISRNWINALLPKVHGLFTLRVISNRNFKLPSQNANEINNTFVFSCVKYFLVILHYHKAFCNKCSLPWS